MSIRGTLAPVDASHFPAFLRYVPGNMESGYRPKTSAVDMSACPHMEVSR